jgi:cob(I)alamin adenosyltransferase
MVRINRVYTRAGDKGETGLAGGKRVGKNTLRIEAYGTVDELNSAIGVALAAGLSPRIAEALPVIQQELFNLGADLATPEPEKEKRPSPRIEKRHVKRLEKAIDEWNADLSELKSFILPGGTAGAAHLHVARTICRRAERCAVALSREEEIGDNVVPYLNRLSDALFVMARLENAERGIADVLWDSRAY